MLTREQLINEYRARGAGLPALLGVYALLLLVLGLTASVIV